MLSITKFALFALASLTAFASAAPVAAEETAASPPWGPPGYGGPPPPPPGFGYGGPPPGFGGPPGYGIFHVLFRILELITIRRTRWTWTRRARWTRGVLVLDRV